MMQDLVSSNENQFIQFSNLHDKVNYKSVTKKDSQLTVDIQSPIRKTTQFDLSDKKVRRNFTTIYKSQSIDEAA